MNDKIYVKSMVNGIVGITLPDLRFKKEWPRKGTRLPIDREILKEAIYDPGVERMLKEGILFIEDMDFKKEMGLEPEDVTEPTNIIEMDDKLCQRAIRLMPVHELKALLEKLSPSQKESLADYAISHYAELAMDRLDILSKACGIDILNAISMKKQMEAED